MPEASSSQSEKSVAHPSGDRLCNVAYAVKFVAQHQKEAEILAKQIGVPTENILGVAAHESQWGAGRIAVEDNNYFSMHAPAPFQSRVDTAKNAPNVKVAVYDSFLQSGQSFLLRFGKGLKGKSTPEEFAEALVAARFNTGSAKTGGRNGYAQLVANDIKSVKRRMACGAK